MIRQQMMLKQQEQNDLLPQQSTTTSDHQFWASITSRNKQLESNKVEVINPASMTQANKQGVVVVFVGREQREQCQNF